MNLFASLRYLAPTLLLVPAVSAQSTLSVRAEGTVMSITGAPPSPFAGAAVGEAISATYDVLLPGTPGQTSGQTYQVDPASVVVRVGAAVDVGAPVPSTLEVDVSATAAALTSDTPLASGLALNLLLVDVTPVATLSSNELAMETGTFPALDFDFAFLNLVGSGFGIQGEFTQIVIGSGSGGGLGASYCGPAVMNSAGTAGRIVATGSSAVAQNDLTLRASSLPTFSFSFFLASQTQGLTPNAGGSQGTLCLGGAIGRFVGPGQIQNSGAAGATSLTLDLTQLPQPNGPVAGAAGETWNFQAWYRDTAGGAATSNFTDGLSVVLQ